jgi:hypothetical protein
MTSLKYLKDIIEQFTNEINDIKLVAERIKNLYYEMLKEHGIKDLNEFGSIVNIATLKKIKETQYINIEIINEIFTKMASTINHLYEYNFKIDQYSNYFVEQMIQIDENCCYELLITINSNGYLSFNIIGDYNNNINITNGELNYKYCKIFDIWSLIENKNEISLEKIIVSVLESLKSKDKLIKQFNL